jgi:hypothetical protein
LAGDIILEGIVLVKEGGRGLRTDRYMLKFCTGEDIDREEVCGTGSSARTRIGRVNPQTISRRRSM